MVLDACLKVGVFYEEERKKQTKSQSAHRKRIWVRLVIAIKNGQNFIIQIISIFFEYENMMHWHDEKKKYAFILLLTFSLY